MPALNFKLTSSRLSFSAQEKSDEWTLAFSGTCERYGHRDTFTIQGENGSWSGFGAEVTVWINLRPPRAEVAGIPPNSPWVSSDDPRDVIHITCPNEYLDRPYFQVSIWLPPDAYERVANVDWTRQAVSLWVQAPLFGTGELPFVFGGDPDGHDQVWRIAVRPYEYLEEVTISLTPTATQKVSLEDQTLQASADDEEPATQVRQILDSVERATASVGELRATIVRVAWVLVAVMVISAFIR